MAKDIEKDKKLSNDEYIDSVIKRINEIKAITKERDLTKEEFEEREKLRKIFIENFRKNFKSMLDNIEIVDKKDK